MKLFAIALERVTQPTPVIVQPSVSYILRFKGHEEMFFLSISTDPLIPRTSRVEAERSDLEYLFS